MTVDTTTTTTTTAALSNGHVDDWKLTNGHGYILNRTRARDHAAAARLNLQFYLWRQALGYNIHPSIATALPPTAAIADVAAGSGIWLVDVAGELPRAQLQGFDLDVRQAPHATLLPPNVRMSQLDLRQDIPPELEGRFDYVHTRLLLLVVEDGDPRPILRRMLALLKPGGRLQWDELDTVHARVPRAADRAQPTPALDRLCQWSRAGGRHDWTVRLAAAMADVGLVDPATDFVADPPALSRAFNDQHLLTVEEFADGLVHLGQPEAAAAYFRLLEQAYAESVDGAALCVPRVVCTARKPA